MKKLMVATSWQFVKFLILMLYKLTIKDFLIIMIMLHYMHALHVLCSLLTLLY